MHMYTGLVNALSPHALSPHAYSYSLYRAKGNLTSNEMTGKLLFFVNKHGS